MDIGIESEKIEFKKTTNELNESLKDISAILNKHGEGVLYFGVKNNGEVVGFQINDNTLRDVSRKINESIEPKIYPIIEKLNIDNKKIIKVSFKGKNPPYSANGIYYIRVSDESRIMSQEELINEIKSIHYNSFWEETITEFTIDDIDDSSLLDFYKKAVNSNRLIMDVYNKENLLKLLNLMNDNHLNKAGYYLFGKNVNLNLKCSIYATDEKLTFIDLNEYRGNIYQLVDVAQNYVNSNTRRAIKFDGSRNRIDVPEIPKDALREIIVNSFAHAQYEFNSEHEINIFPSSVAIYNPGKFPKGLTPLDFIETQRYSLTRNKIILDVLYRSKDVEKSATGFKRVNELCKQNDINYSFNIDEYGFTFIFERKNLNTFDKDKEIHFNIKTNVLLTKTQEDVYNALKNDNTLTIEKLSAILSKSNKTIIRALKFLTDNKFIIREGSKKNGHYKIIN